MFPSRTSNIRFVAVVKVQADEVSLYPPRLEELQQSLQRCCQSADERGLPLPPTP